MTPHIGPALLAAGFVVLAANNWDPYILHLYWSNGRHSSAATTSPEVCETARRAIASGRWTIEPGPVPETTCAPGNLFAKDADCIPGYVGPRAEGFCQ